ncbi:MAG: hypothetical protein H6Q89_2952 [Myxococcaceae bacterium]|nr:hypothetical protein [Myxococcaceae bacterium]
MIAALLLLALAAEPTWTKLDTVDGIEVSSREVPGEKLVELKLTAQASASVEKLCEAAFGKATLDPREPDITTRKLISQSANERVTYEQISAPVVSDRDYAVRATRQFGANGSCRMRFEVANDLAPPVPDGFVRIEKLKGYWDFEPGANGSTRASYLIFTDPAGAIPTVFVEGPRRKTALKWFKLVLERAGARPQVGSP